MTRLPLAAFTLLQGILLLVEGLTSYDTFGRQNALMLTNVMAVAGVWLFDRLLRRRAGRGISWPALLIVAAGVWIDALGNFQHWFAEYWWWDRLSHAAGGMAVTSLFIDLLRAKRPLGDALLVGFLWGQFFGGMYEVSEWLGDVWFDTHRVQNVFDAPRDLGNNLIGGLIVAGLFWLTGRRKRLRTG